MVRPGVAFADLPREVLRRGLIKVEPARQEAWIAERIAEHRRGDRKLLDHRRGRWVAVDESRTPSGHIVVIHTDVTELKRREEDARHSRRVLRDVIDAVPAIINVKDRSARYVLMNRFQGTVYGSTPRPRSASAAPTSSGWTMAACRRRWTSRSCRRARPCRGRSAISSMRSGKPIRG